MGENKPRNWVHWNEGDTILDFAGPLGIPSKLDNVKKAAVIGEDLVQQLHTLRQKIKFPWG